MEKLNAALNLCQIDVMMRLKLKEDPREWLKFAAVFAVVLGMATVWFWRKQVIAQNVLTGILITLSLALGAAKLRPRLARPLYRGGMTISFYLGQVIGRVLLAIFFLCALTPVGLLLRLLGKDLLRLKRNATATSYWESAKFSDKFERMF